MNTRGPNGGKGKTNQTSARGSTSRSVGYTAAAGKNRGDTSTISSRNLQGQKASTSRIGVRSQAKVNRGPMTDYNVSGQRMGRTQTPKTPARVSQQGQPRATQNTMTGSGKSRE